MPTTNPNAPTPNAGASALTTIENALTAAQNELPSILGIISTFVPQLKPLLAFFPLIGVALNAVKVVQQATGGTAQDATAAVISHLTPNLPNAPSLANQQGSGG